MIFVAHKIQFYLYALPTNDSQTQFLLSNSTIFFLLRFVLPSNSLRAFPLRVRQLLAGGRRSNRSGRGIQLRMRAGLARPALCRARAALRQQALQQQGRLHRARRRLLMPVQPIVEGKAVRHQTIC